MDSVKKKGERELLASRFSVHSNRKPNNLLFILSLIVLVLFANVILTVNITGVDVFSGASVASIPLFSADGNSITGAVVLDPELATNTTLIQTANNSSNTQNSTNNNASIVNNTQEIILLSTNSSVIITNQTTNNSTINSTNFTNTTNPINLTTAPSNNSLTGAVITNSSSPTNNTQPTQQNNSQQSQVNTIQPTSIPQNSTSQNSTSQTSQNTTAQPEILSSQNDTIFSTNVDVSSCSTLNTQGAIYNLTANINSTGTCLTISADDIIVDGHGYEILYATSSNGFGITIDGNDNITIKNVNIRETNTGSGNSYGIEVSNADGINITNVTVSTLGSNDFTNRNDHGITFDAVGNSSIEYTNISVVNGRGSKGIIFTNSDNNSVIYSSAFSDLYEFVGLDMSGSSGNYITNNSFHQTDTQGISSDGIIVASSNSDHNFFTDNYINAATYASSLTPGSTESTTARGIFISSSTMNNFSGNTIITSRAGALRLYGTTNAHYTHVFGNTNIVEGLPANYTSGVGNSNRTFEGIDFSTYGLVVVVFADNVTFRNSNFSGEGIQFYFSENSSIINSTITSNDGDGLYARDSDYLLVRDTSISTNERGSYGISLIDTDYANFFNTDVSLVNDLTGSFLARSSTYITVENMTVSTSNGNLNGLELASNSDYPHFKNFSITATGSFNINTVIIGTASHGLYEDFDCSITSGFNTYCIIIQGNSDNNTFRGGSWTSTSTTFTGSQPNSVIFNSGTLTNFLFYDLIFSTVNFADIAVSGSIGAGSIITFRNVSSDENFTINDVDFVGRWENYFRANVTDSGSPVNGANVTVNYANGSQAFSVLTDATGVTGKHNLTEYNITSNGLIYKSPYSITITATNYATDTATLNFSDNYVYNASLLPAIPQVTILNPTNGSNRSFDFSAFNTSVPGSNTDTVIFMFNTNTTPFNVTATNVSGNWNANVNISTLEEGLQNVTVYANDTTNTVNQTEYVTFKVDRTIPVVNMQNISFNTSDTTPSFTFNYTDSYAVANCTLLVDNDHNASNYLTQNDTNTILTASLLKDGQYNISIKCVDGANNTGIGNNISIFVDNANPSVVNVTYTPTVSDDVDPETLFTFNATVSDVTSSIQTVFLQVYNGTDWLNRTMTNIGGNIYQGNYTTLSGDRNYTFNVFANDTINNVNVSANQTINAAWDCSWLSSPTDLGATAGFSTTKTLGNIYLNNTGDPQFSDTNCTLDFRFSYSLTSGRILFDGDSLKPSSIYSLSAGSNQTIEVNATFLAEQREDTETITVSEIRGRSNKSAANISATIVSSQGGAYLFNAIDSYPTTVSLTNTPFTLEGYVRNLVGNGSVQTAANNVSFNWSLPAGFTVSNGTAAVFYNYMDNSTAQYNNINITFSSTDLDTLSPGFVTVAVTAQGKNSSGDFIVHASDNQIVTSSVQILLECYNVSDGIQVPECGSLDGDYVESTTTTTTTTSSSSGGGGGGGSLISTGGSTAEQRQRLFQTEDSYELLRGRQEVFKLKMENPFRHPLEDVTISINGFLAQYLSVSPNVVERIEVNDTRTFEISIQAPEYFTRGKHDLQFIIDGTIVGPGLLRTAMQETRDVTLVIHEISQEEAIEFNGDIEKYIAEMVEQGLNVREINELAQQANAYLSQKEYELVKETHDSIKLQRDQAFQTLSILADLETGISKSKRNGLDVPETERLLLLVQAALERGDYTTAMQRAEDARTAYVLETAGRFNLFGFIKGNWLSVSVGFIIFVILSTLIYLFIKDRLINRKLGILAKEESVLLGLIKQIQEECFVKRKLSMKEYLDSLMQYEQRMDEIIQETVRQESLKSNLFKFFKGEYERLLEERLRTVHLVKKTQKMYLTAGAIETRIYQNKMKSYTERLSEIEERIANKEAQMATEKGSKAKITKWKTKALQRAKQAVAKQEKDQDILSEAKGEVIKEAEQRKEAPLDQALQKEQKKQEKKGIGSIFAALKAKRQEKPKGKQSKEKISKQKSKAKKHKHNIDIVKILPWVVEILVAVTLAVLGYIQRAALAPIIIGSYNSLETNISLILLTVAIIAVVIFIVFLLRSIIHKKRGKKPGKKDHKLAKQSQKLEAKKKQEVARLEKKRKEQEEKAKARKAALAKKASLQQKREGVKKQEHSKHPNKTLQAISKHITLILLVLGGLILITAVSIFKKTILNWLFTLYVIAAVEVISLLVMISFIAIFYLVVHFFWRPHKNTIKKLSRSTKKEQEKLFKLELYQHKVKEAARQGTLNAKNLEMDEGKKETKQEDKKENKKRDFFSFLGKKSFKNKKTRAVKEEKQSKQKLEWDSYFHERTFTNEIATKKTLKHAAKKEHYTKKKRHKKDKKSNTSHKNRSFPKRVIPAITIVILLALIALSYIYFKAKVDTFLISIYDTPQKQLIALLVSIIVIASLIVYAIFKLFKAKRRKKSLTQTDLSLELQIGKKDTKKQVRVKHKHNKKHKKQRHKKK